MNQDGYAFEDLCVGMSASFAKTVTEADILLFSSVSGDTNPVHLNREYAQETIFGERIAHGMLSASLISTVLGTRLPGPGTIYLGQDLRFKAPVRIGDTVTATVAVDEVIPEKNRVRMTTICSVGGQTVIDGLATIMVPSRATETLAAE